MSWISVNMALAAVFFTAWCGIPLWMVLRHPSWSHAPADSYRSPAATSSWLRSKGATGAGRAAGLR